MNACVAVGYALGDERWLEVSLRAGSEAEVVAHAARDALAGRFGRAWVGLTVTEVAPGRLPDLDPGGRAVPELPRFAIAPDAALAAPEPALLPDPPGGDVAWFRHESAAGFGGDVGVALRRCAAVDPEVAEEAAQDLVLRCTHQTSVYPVAAVVLPHLVALLARPDVRPRATLARGLGELLAASAGRRPTPRAFDRAVAALRRTVFGADAERVLRREVEAAAAVREARRPLSAALRALAADPVVGPLAFAEGG